MKKKKKEEKGGRKEGRKEGKKCLILRHTHHILFTVISRLTYRKGTHR